MMEYNTDVFVVLAALILILNIVTFGLFGWARSRRHHRHYRIPDKVLFILGVCGGAVGALAGMYVFQYLKDDVRFKKGLPVIFIIEVIAVFLVWYFVFYKPIGVEGFIK